MKSTIIISTLLSLSAVNARPMNTASLMRREVPQEHSHEQFLTTVRASLNANNPDGIVDPVFGLLGNAAAAAGLGSLKDTECLQQSTADQAFTNAKAASDVAGMTAALIYRALERNTGKHQDPASTGAAATNKAIALELAKQISSIGGDPQDAIKSGTFAPGSTSDNTGKGNSCDDANDPVGCAFTQNLLVPDVTADEIAAAATGGAAAGTSTGGASTAPTATNSSTSTGSDTGSASVCTVVAAAAAAAADPLATSTTGSTPSLDLGSCANASIVFGAGFDGRTEDSFKPADPNSFDHGSADNIKVISGFICQQLVDKCKASATTTTAACAKGSAAADALSGQAAADAFNAALA